MNIKLVKRLTKADFVTHGGTFHADDVFSTIFLSKLHNKLKLIRLINVENLDISNKLVYDIGFGKFDHHQSNFDKKRKNGIKYASFGLLWKEFGKEYLNSLNLTDINYLSEYIDKEFVQQIDAIDNGQFPEVTSKYPLKNLDSLIANFNPLWDEKKDYDSCFLKACYFADNIFEREIKSAISKYQAKLLVEKEVEKQNGPILILDNYLPYKEGILNNDNPKASKIKFVITPSNRGGYGIHTIVKSLQTKETRLDFPSSWGGLQNEALQKETGVKTAIFCHKNLFLATTKTKEDAILLANLAIERGKEEGLC